MRRLPHFLATALLGSLLLLLAGGLQASEGAVAVIEAATGEVVDLIEAGRAHYREDTEALQRDVKAVLLPVIDQVYSARLVLGRHGRGLEQEQVHEFADALANQLLNRYATVLLDFDLKDRVEVLDLAGKNTERQTRVRTRVRLDSGERAPVDYVLRKTGDGWKLFDVIVEGISYVATFRSQIDQEIRATSFEDMLGRMQRGDFEVEIDE